MFGWLAFILVFSVSNFALILAIGTIVYARQKKKNIPWLRIASYLVMQVVFSYITLPILYHQLENLLFIRTITAKEISSIQINSTAWTTPQDIEAIVDCLNQAEWYEKVRGIPNGSPVPITITFQSGKIWKARVRSHYEKDGAVLEFFYPLNEQGSSYLNYGTAYAPGLRIIFENIGYSLPQ